MSSVAELIRRTRERAGQTQVEAANEIGTTENTFARWERGENEPQAGLYLNALLEWIAKHNEIKERT